ncbi:hypothetical protein UNSW3_1498 [Campylobacter concisus UNSW3]|uniref:Uncharacterized protein n=1 Tax=Campylobacter concisus UNSW3 TaxID=1242966 RepID=U2EWH5_9BACT|nr:hypothetical protein [Campylobacter concisus]ERJ22005.1 hypothetical protein UNSW3_1498 [Campylobacter concisus UNSW3]
MLLPNLNDCKFEALKKVKFKSLLKNINLNLANRPSLNLEIYLSQN